MSVYVITLLYDDGKLHLNDAARLLADRLVWSFRTAYVYLNNREFMSVLN